MPKRYPLHLLLLLLFMMAVGLQQAAAGQAKTPTYGLTVTVPQPDNNAEIDMALTTENVDLDESAFKELITVTAPRLIDHFIHNVLNNDHSSRLPISFIHTLKQPPKF